MNTREQAECIGFTICRIEEERDGFGALTDENQREASRNRQKDAFVVVGRELLDVVTKGTTADLTQIGTGYRTAKSGADTSNMRQACRCDCDELRREQLKNAALQLELERARESARVCDERAKEWMGRALRAEGKR